MKLYSIMFCEIALGDVRLPDVETPADSERVHPFLALREVGFGVEKEMHGICEASKKNAHFNAVKVYDNGRNFPRASHATAIMTGSKSQIRQIWDGITVEAIRLSQQRIPYQSGGMDDQTSIETVLRGSSIFHPFVERRKGKEDLLMAFKN